MYTYIYYCLKRLISLKGRVMGRKGRDRGRVWGQGVGSERKKNLSSLQPGLRQELILSLPCGCKGLGILTLAESWVKKGATGSQRAPI